MNSKDKYRKFHEEMLKEMGLRNDLLKETEKSLHAETKRRKETEEQHACHRTELNDIRKLKQEMLNEIEGLKMQNTKLQTEKDEIVRKLEEFQMWLAFAPFRNHLEANFKEFTYAEIKAATDDFNDSYKIGEGGYGIVYKAFLQDTTVAVKIPKFECSHGDREYNKEVEIMAKISHPNIVKLIGACPETHALVYELMPNGNLEDILRRKNRSKVLTWKTRIRIASDICSALIFLHSAKPYSIVHGDIKSANILLDSKYTGNICDFGVCRQLYPTDNMQNYYTVDLKGTPPYMDPEYFSSGEMTTQYDVYSFGIVLLELVTGRDAMGLRKRVTDALKIGKNFVDAFAGDWPFEEAKRMVLLGLKCSDPSRENRPDLVMEVWVEIESMRHASLCF